VFGFEGTAVLFHSEHGQLYGGGVSAVEKAHLYGAVIALPHRSVAVIDAVYVSDIDSSPAGWNVAVWPTGS